MMDARISRVDAALEKGDGLESFGDRTLQLYNESFQPEADPQPDSREFARTIMSDAARLDQTNVHVFVPQPPCDPRKSSRREQLRLRRRLEGLDDAENDKNMLDAAILSQANEDSIPSRHLKGLDAESGKSIHDSPRLSKAHGQASSQRSVKFDVSQHNPSASGSRRVTTPRFPHRAACASSYIEMGAASARQGATNMTPSPREPWAAPVSATMPPTQLPNTGDAKAQAEWKLSEDMMHVKWGTVLRTLQPINVNGGGPTHSCKHPPAPPQLLGGGSGCSRYHRQFYAASDAYTPASTPRALE